MHVVFGLGNPGKRYLNTRHNIGFILLDYIQSIYKVPFRPGKGDYYFMQCAIEQETVLFVKPTTYMNLSGIAVRQVVERFEIDLSDILVVLDDFQLPFGMLRFRKKGSAGGHNGLKSVIAELGSEDFARLRFGIGTRFEDAVDFVLSDFTEKEIDGLKQLLPIAHKGIVVWVKDGIDRAMNQFNRQFFEADLT